MTVLSTRQAFGHFAQFTPIRRRYMPQATWEPTSWRPAASRVYVGARHLAMVADMTRGAHHPCAGRW